MANDTFIANGIGESLWAAREFQCAATELYDKGRLSPAFVLSTAALEHLGRALWLGTKGIKLSDAAAAKKIKLDHSIGLKDGLQVICWSSPAGSPTLQFEQVQKVAARKPDDIHKLRQRAQYVEAFGSNWKSPREAVTKDKCHELLLNVANSFGWVRSHLAPALPLMQSELSANASRDTNELYPKPERG